MQARSAAAYIDDAELDEPTLADMLLETDESVVTAGASNALASRGSTAQNGAGNVARTSSGRIMTASGSRGRLGTGFARSSAASRGGTAARAASRGGTAGTRALTSYARPTTTGGRPVTSSGRFVRLGTASIMGQGTADAADSSSLLDLSQFNPRRIVQRMAHMAPLIFEALLLDAERTDLAMALACEVLRNPGRPDAWWWYAARGRCQYRLSLYREAEGSFRGSLRGLPNILASVFVARLRMRVDQPRRRPGCCDRMSRLFPIRTVSYVAAGKDTGCCW